MIFFEETRTIGQDGNGKNVVWVSIHVDAAADLPAYNDYQSDGFILCMGSTAHTIADNKLYALNSSGVWVDITPNSGAYTLPPATANSLGGIMVGTGLTIDGAGVLSASGASMPYTNHNGGIRGNNLGNSYTASQQSAIASGDFTDIYVGDYWEISGIKYYIVDIDYYFNYGNPTPTTDHHVIVFPDKVLSAQGYAMDAPYYAASTVFTTYLPAIAAQLETTFGSFLISQPTTLFASASASWISAKCILPSMIQIQGYSQQIPNNLVQQKSEIFSYFRYKKDLFASDQRYWLRDTDGGGTFAFFTQNAQVYFHASSNTYYLRPYFILSGTAQT